jgi:hypothetical protein
MHSPVAKLAILIVDVFVYKPRRPLHEPKRRSSGPITGTAYVDSDQASSIRIASLGWGSPETKPCGKNIRV